MLRFPRKPEPTGRRLAVRRGAFTGGCLAALLLAGGCHRPTPPDEPTAAVLGETDDLTPLWNATLSVLRKHGFQPDRQDRAMGVIETRPTTGMQWHEPWRQDVADAYSLFESSIHTTQRRVKIRFIRGPQWSVEVEVGVYRLRRPETQITTASAALHGFSGRLPTREGKVYEQGQLPDRWVFLRRDPVMESRLLQAILSRAAEQM
ncbi:MAG: hypothetical protein ACE5E1_02145 [Phycisphaerae bacterium]